MSVGNQATQAQINATLTNLSVGLRELASDVLQAQAYYNKLGLTGLQGLGFTTQDAQAVLDNINHMATVAGCYKGTVQQGGSGGAGAILFNFEDYLTPLWAGQ